MMGAKLYHLRRQCFHSESYIRKVRLPPPFHLFIALALGILTIPFVFFSALHYSDTTRCSRLILDFHCLLPRIRHFFKMSWSVLIGNCIQNQYLGAGYWFVSEPFICGRNNSLESLPPSFWIWLVDLKVKTSMSTFPGRLKSEEILWVYFYRATSRAARGLVFRDAELNHCVPVNLMHTLTG
jgi:hypothetical protein